MTASEVHSLLWSKWKLKNHYLVNDYVHDGVHALWVAITKEEQTYVCENVSESHDLVVGNITLCLGRCFPNNHSENIINYNDQLIAQAYS